MSDHFAVEPLFDHNVQHGHHLHVEHPTHEFRSVFCLLMGRQCFRYFTPLWIARHRYEHVWVPKLFRVRNGIVHVAAHISLASDVCRGLYDHASGSNQLALVF